MSAISRPKLPSRMMMIRLLAVGSATSLIFALSFWNFIVFHTSVELVTIVVSLSCTAALLYTHREIRSGYFVIVGTAYVFVAIIDLLHTLSYGGLAVFPGFDSNLPTQLWIAARVLESVALLGGALLSGRVMRIGRLFAIGTGYTAIVIMTTMILAVFPDCYLPGSGLTTFKKATEYIIAALFLAGAVVIYRTSDRYAPSVRSSLIAAALLSAVGELAFTLYRSPFGIANSIGHIIRLFSVACVASALVRQTILDPISTAHREHQRLAMLRDQLRSREKLEAIGTLSAGIAHDFNNILMAIIGYATLLSNELHDERLHEYTEHILTAARRASNLSDRIIAFSDPKEAGLAVVDPATIIDETVELLRSTIPDHIYLSVSSGPTIQVRIDPTQLHEVVMNLAMNAIHSMKGETQGTLSIVTRLSKGPAKRLTVPSGKKDYAVLEVRDTGAGIAPEIVDRIFDPFFTTKPFGRGSGLGLSIVHGLVTANGGHITVESTPQNGTCFSVYLPVFDIGTVEGVETTRPQGVPYEEHSHSR